MRTMLLAITMGDPAGVGPETIVGAWPNATIHRQGRMCVVGNPEVMRRAVGLLGLPIIVEEIRSPEECQSSPSALPCLACGSSESANVPPAAVDARGGQAAYDALVTATRLALDQRVDAIVTAPLNKAALVAAGHDYPGHTELLGELCGVRDVAMMLYLAPGAGILGRAGLGVVHATLHTALRSVFDQLTEERIVASAHLAAVVTHAFLDPISQTRKPAIGVCALNPHAGEQGLFGDEEIRIIDPAVKRCQREGLAIVGPLPADTLMVRAAGGDFDVVVAMYHDQGHIALKLLGMHRAVNITLGLPIIRTSVAHGTAFDLAWRGKAYTTGMVAALDAAVKLVDRREQLDWTRPTLAAAFAATGVG